MSLTAEEQKTLSSLFAKMDSDNLQYARYLFNTTAETIRRSERAKFTIGDLVQFRSATGNLVGTIIKINPKLIKVSILNGGIWRVNPSLLSKVA